MPPAPVRDVAARVRRCSARRASAPRRTGTRSAPATTSLAGTDIARWINTLQTQIHTGACGSITCAAGACTVNVRWDDSRATGGAAAQVVSMRAQL